MFVPMHLRAYKCSCGSVESISLTPLSSISRTRSHSRSRPGACSCSYHFSYTLTLPPPPSHPLAFYSVLSLFISLSPSRSHALSLAYSSGRFSRYGEEDCQTPTATRDILLLLHLILLHLRRGGWGIAHRDLI